MCMYVSQGFQGSGVGGNYMYLIDINYAPGTHTCICTLLLYEMP